MRKCKNADWLKHFFSARMIISLRERRGNMKVPSIMIKDVPKEDRPRERLLKLGSDHLSNQELLAILLGSGTKSESVMDLSNRLLMHFEGIKLLAHTPIEELTASKGLGPGKAVVILAATARGSRPTADTQHEREKTKSHKD